MTKKLIFIVMLAVGIISTLSAKLDLSEFKTTESGLKYRITEHGNGPKAQKGNIVKVHYIAKHENEKVFENSYEEGEPHKFELGIGRVIKGWDEGIALLKVGDKATFVIPPELGYGDMSIGNIQPKSTLIFEVELVDVQKYKPFNIVGKDAIFSKSGLKFYVLQKGEGDSPKKGSKVKVHYTGYFKDGKMFDSSVERGKPFEFILGVGQVIKGWDEGVSLMKKGGKIRFIIPYNLAYGESGRPPKIPPKSELTFDIQLLDFD
ncbi:MAG: FKBP-type peptidyl-prolyl cis-trans isomerase [Candidatus Cloacimonetes bacterium]|nr:FKBP-type peptidyl-prolyl cis-trans isomerase [Candidatus Cloacimonadota bacterium]